MRLEHVILTSAGQAWPPFVLVTGLLLIGAAASADGLFDALGLGWPMHASAHEACCWRCSVSWPQ